MQILLRRNAGWLGRFASLDVFINDEKACVIGKDETKAVVLPMCGGTLRVEMQSAVSSPSIRVGPESDDSLFECGTAWWVPFDILSLCYLGFLKQRVFYLRPVKPAETGAVRASGGANGA